MQIPDDIRKSVAFVCYHATTGSDALSLAGTAFYVIVPSEVKYTFGYIVAAKHVIVGIQQKSVDGNVFIRANCNDGTSSIIQSLVSDWKFHPDDPSVNVAVMPGFLEQDVFDTRPISVETAATNTVINEHRIGAGDEVFLAGLFVNHFGRDRNLPIIRAGNIALIPENQYMSENLGR